MNPSPDNRNSVSANPLGGYGAFFASDNADVAKPDGGWATTTSTDDADTGTDSADVAVSHEIPDPEPDRAPWLVPTTPPPPPVTPLVAEPDRATANRWVTGTAAGSASAPLASSAAVSTPTGSNSSAAEASAQQTHSTPPPAAPQYDVAPPQVRPAAKTSTTTTSTALAPAPAPAKVERKVSAEIAAVGELRADISVSNRATLRSSHGMRGALNKVGFSLGLSGSERRAEERRARIRKPLPSTYQVAVVSVKGGVGRTTTTAALGATFASLRADRVVAIDANPDFGDLATRTIRHPYGLTLRDLVHASDLHSFSAVQAYTVTNTDDLVVVASPWTSEASDPLSGTEYAAGVEILRRHYSLLLTDCGTGVLDSVTGGVLSTSDAVLVVTPATVGGVTGAVATLNWLRAHGLHHLVTKSTVAIVGHQPTKPNIDVSSIEKVFAGAQRPTFVLPYDPHLAEGREIDLRLLHNDTKLALEELAASLTDDFPTYREARQ